MLILGYESSCDDTGVALYDAKTGKIEHLVHSQNAIHAIYGGVVPELASRDHIKKCLPLTRALLQRTGVALADIDGIAYTAGPGLLGAILVGATLAKSLAWSLQIPCLGVHHLEGHLLAPMLEEHKPRYPFIALLVSGGHTQLIQVDGLGQYRLLGDTLDDAVGEAFDKTAKLLGLPYPGGAALAALAEQGDAARFHFPRPMTQRDGLEFSFSGLKTCAAQLIAKVTPPDEQTRCDIAAAFQLAIVDTLVIKCRRAMEMTGLTQLVVSGGVSANRLLRARLQQLSAEQGLRVFFPRLEFCTDNAAMIAYVGACRLQAGERDQHNTEVRARWPLEELTAPVASAINS